MKNIYQISTAVFAFITVLVSTACDDYLDLKPTDSLISANAITDQKTANAAVIGAYSALKSYSTGSYLQLGVLPGDNVTFGGSQTLNIELDNHAFSVSNPAIVGAYRANYQMINRCNWIISEIPKISDPGFASAEKDVLLGEAYFIRAFAYFNLARSWGGMQLQLEPTLDLKSIGSVKRSTQQETYDQVIADLQQAERLLPDDGVTRNRAQKSAARALLARVYLYAGEWEQAEEYATQVIENPKYELVYPYHAFFKGPFLSKESVFEITATSHDPNSGWRLWYPSSVVKGGSYEYQPAPAIVKKLSDPAVGGGRKVLLDSTTENSTIYYSVLYHTTQTTADFSANTDPAYVIRLAELYLIRAEARAKKVNPDIAGAIRDLNVIRERADADLLSETESDPQNVVFAIEEERRLEFAFEGHRWYDLVRTGRAKEVLGVEESYWLFPIPNADVLADPDLEGENNPNY